MKKLTLDEMEKLEAGGVKCAASIGLSAVAGGIFGGIGCVVGAAVAATGPSCLGWW